jgi:hypothetical protein
MCMGSRHLLFFEIKNRVWVHVLISVSFIVSALYFIDRLMLNTILVCCIVSLRLAIVRKFV